MERECSYIARNISTIYRISSAHFSKELKKLNIGSGQYLYMIYLYNNEGCTQEEMSTRLSIDKGTTAKAIKRLEEEGYVKRIPHEEDKRAYRVYITPKGFEIKKEFYEVLQNWNFYIEEALKDDEIKELNTLLNKIIKKINI